jgi:MFS family permease
MARVGRRPGLALGYALAVGGASLGIAGVGLRSFALMLIGMALFGVAQTSNLLARYAAADVSPGPARGRVMGLIVWGSAAGAMLGPNLMRLAAGVGGRLGLTPAASAFLISVAGYGLAACIVHLFLRPDPMTVARLAAAPSVGSPSITRPRPIGEIVRDARVRIALGALVVSQLVMIGTTSTSPVYLHDQGHHVGTIGVAVSLHLAGMYVTSPLSGWLSDRFGRIAIIVAGGCGLIGAVVLTGLVPGHASALVILGLFLNGIGWNLAFVAGSALLTDALAPVERASIQGLADLAMGLSGALGSAAGGLVLGAWGFLMLNMLGAVLVLGPILAAWLGAGRLWLGQRVRRTTW